MLIALPLGAAIAAWQLLGPFGDSDRAPRYATSSATVTDIAQRVTATGTLSAVVTVEVGSQVSGRIKELHADYNSRVDAGQVIALIDPDLFASALAQANARRAAATAALARARTVAARASLESTRAAKLAAAGLISDAELETADAEYRSATASVSAARAELTLARAAVEQARVNLEYTTIRSPIGGVVVSRHVDVGQTVAASLAAPKLFVIAEDLRRMELHTSVAESDVGVVRAGMSVEFSVDAYPKRVFHGTVKQVRFEAVTVSNVVTYDAVVRVDNDDLALRPGMTANVSFLIAERHDALVVANRALRYRPAAAHLLELARAPPSAAAGTTTLWVLRDGAPTPLPVRTGLTDGRFTEILGGDLREGDAVVVGEGDGDLAAPTASPTGAPPRRGRRGPPRVL